MRCPHCTKEIHFEKCDSWVFEYEEPKNEATGYDIVHAFCPACNELLVVMRDGKYYSNTSTGEEILEDICREEFLYPKSYSRPVESEVPEELAENFQEAAEVKCLSPKASAALSRRLLQHLLREICKVKKSSLSVEIEEYINQPGIPRTYPKT